MTDLTKPVTSGLTDQQRLVLTALASFDGWVEPRQLALAADRQALAWWGHNPQHPVRSIAGTMGSLARRQLARRKITYHTYKVVTYKITAAGREALRAESRPGGRPAVTADAERGGYAAVAAVLNAAYIWPHPVSRQQVHAWDSRRTVNQLSQLPPGTAAPAHDGMPRVFRTADWVDWARPGVPGPRRRGWTVPRARQDAA